MAEAGITLTGSGISIIGGISVGGGPTATSTVEYLVVAGGGDGSGGAGNNAGNTGGSGANAVVNWGYTKL